MPDARISKLLVIAGLSGLAVALAIAGLLLSRPATTRSDFAPGASSTMKQPAPAVTLALLDGRSAALAEHKGRPVLVNFFASWCLPCRDEMPAIQKVAREYEPKGVAFLGVAVDDTEAKVKEFVARYGVTFPVGLDTGASVQKAFGIYGIPTTYFIDRQGVINYFHSGAVTEELLRHELDKLL